MGGTMTFVFRKVVLITSTWSIDTLSSSQPPGQAESALLQRPAGYLN
jgi:hypothetical protein